MYYKVETVLYKLCKYSSLYYNVDDIATSCKKIIRISFFLNARERFKFYVYIRRNYGKNFRKSMDSVKLCNFQYNKCVFSFEKLQELKNIIN